MIATVNRVCRPTHESEVHVSSLERALAIIELALRRRARDEAVAAIDRLLS